MKTKDEDLYLNYSELRDYFIRTQNNFLACFYQIAVIYVIVNTRFYFLRKKEIKEQWDILNDMLESLMGFYDEAFFKGFYYEIVAVYLENDDIQCKENCKKADEYYKKSNRMYPVEAIGVHITYLQEYYQENKKGKEYVYALLRSFEERYGKNSFQFAEMWIHILGEVICFQNEEEFCDIFYENIAYFDRYLVQYDYYLECFYAFIYQLLSGKDKRYADFFKRYEDMVENCKNSRLYFYHKVKVEYLKAKDLEMQSQNAEAAEILRNAVYSYIRSEKNVFFSPFYGYVYLMAAVQYHRICEYTEMAQMAEFGIELCIEAKITDTELYYSLYNFRGLKCLADDLYKEAGKIWGTSIEYIEHHFGRENINYINYTYNLGLVALKEGRIADGKRYFEILSEIKDEELILLCKSLLKYGRYVMEQLDEETNLDGSVNVLYRETIRAMEESKDKKGQLRTNLLYLFGKVQKNEKVNEKIRKLLEELNVIYLSKGMDKEQECLFNFILILHKWNNGNGVEVISESEKLINDIGEDLYLFSYRDVLICHIQILCLNKRYTEAIAYIREVLEKLYDQIMDSGFGDIQQQLLYMRLILSIYIKIKEKIPYCLDDLYVKIVECKTIEKEILKIIGKYESDDKETSFDFYELQQVHRKIAALKVKRQLMNEKYLNEEEINGIERKIEKYYLKLEGLENKLWSEVDFKKLIPKFKMKDIALPDNAVCVEFFAYYDLNLENPFYDCLKEDSAYFKYAVVGISKCNKTPTVQFYLDIADSELYMDDFFDLFEEMPEEMDIVQCTRIKDNLNENILAPIWKYIEPFEVVYWALDFLLQMIPIEILNNNGKSMIDLKNNIYVDSIRDIHEDILIDIENTDALVIGNPQYNINDMYEQQANALVFSEIECMEIASIMGTTAFLREEARQQIFRERYKADILHISTHGDLIVEDYDVMAHERFLFANSYLILAGFEDWADNRMIKKYGNGLITADDFIFIDLSDTKLVVLSACASGIGLVRGMQSLHGLRWTIGIAGAQSSITALWEVDDLPTAILMIFLYRNLCKMPVGQALQFAKQQLKDLKVREILEDSVLLNMFKKINIDFKPDNQAGYYEYKPFENWRYWAAFVCYFG
ncbi:MAG: CHAT domain-containing protein [Lachnospiraceae bacterium]|nr:CHAT domain-containing protein [Lachnospiraceae bacterium]